MPDRPLLVLPTPVSGLRHRKPGGGGGSIHFPTFRRQRGRVLPRLARVEQAFAAHRAYLQTTVAGLEPEMVVVLETVGRIDEFYRAVGRIEGLEWLTERDEESLPAEEGLFFREDDPRSELPGRLYLVLVNARGLRELLSLWRIYAANPNHPEFQRGRMKWRDLFRQLRDVRPWGPQDRLYETGLAKEVDLRAQAGAESVRVEIEFWHRHAPAQRDRAEAAVAAAVLQANGEILSRAAIEEIEYHALLAEMPLAAAQAIVRMENVRLGHCEEVSFFRPVGQVAFSPSQEEPLIAALRTDSPRPAGDPIVGVLDGLPLENHRALEGRLIVDDPDGWSPTYEPRSRQHGTGMASLVVHSDLESPEVAQSHPVYVRPILKPDPLDYRVPKPECVPENELPVDLVHRAVVRMYETGDGRTPTAPTVRVINLSVADRSRPFDGAVSPWARLIDFLSWKYNILFVVAAGNHSDDIALGVPRADATIRGDRARLQSETLKALNSESWNRRLLSPAESINALTVAAAHEDAVPGAPLGARLDPFESASLLSPINPIGPGHRRSIKPEVLFRGGRQVYREVPGAAGDNLRLTVDESVRSPGLRVSSPGRTAGDIAASVFTRGTSNAAALATGTAGRLYDVLQELRGEPGGDQVTERFIPVLLKALLVHGAHWGDAGDAIASAIANTDKYYVGRFLGYGAADASRVFSCTENRATAIGVGVLRYDGAHAFSVPLPPSLSGRPEWRRLIITLAWLSPIEPGNRLYRKAQLFFSPYGANRDEDQWQLAGVRRNEADWRAARRGTVQHEVFEGDRASAYRDGESLSVQINCSSEIGPFEEEVPYALAVSLEVAQGVPIPVYEEVRARIRARVAVPITSQAGR